MGERRDVHGVMVGKPGGKKTMRRPRWRWEDNIKMYLQKWDVGLWTGFRWLRIGTGWGTCECCNEPPGFIKFREILD